MAVARHDAQRNAGVILAMTDPHCATLHDGLRRSAINALLKCKWNNTAPAGVLATQSYDVALKIKALQFSKIALEVLFSIAYPFHEFR